MDTLFLTDVGCAIGKLFQNFFPLHAKKVKTPTYGFKMKIPRFSVDTSFHSGAQKSPKKFSDTELFFRCFNPVSVSL